MKPFSDDMKTLVHILFILLILCNNCIAQIVATDSSESQKSFNFKPLLGLGTGMFTYYGDISAPHKLDQPLVSRIGYDLSVSQEITKTIYLRFYVFVGKLGANERSLERNLNFESRITTGGIELNYNFNNFLNTDHLVEPYISIGIESCEFLSKTDLKDANGSIYYYWSDGSIRNIDENDPNAENAIRLVRDYTYESDIRELNLDGFGKYAERTWAVPAGIGVNLLLNNRWSFRLGTAMHFTFTDYIEGITEESIGNRKGDAANDRFLMSSFSLNYHFFSKDKKKQEEAERYKDVDFTALNEDDQDNDGIADFSDDCPNTPQGITVNNNGCPDDEDGDGVPDYFDEEAETPDSAVVDENGRTLPDSLIQESYLRYTDSTGLFAQVTHKVDANEVQKKKVSHKYYISMGSYSEEISPSAADIYLNDPDVKTIMKGNDTYFVVKQNKETEQNSAENITPKEKTAHHETNIVENTLSNNSTATNDLVIYRVQLGAFSRKLPESTFLDFKDVLEVPSNDGITRYYSGSFSDINEATKHKNKAEMNGFKGAFVVPFKNGKRISFSDAEQTVTKQQNNLEKIKDRKEIISDQTSNVTFAVQVASCKERASSTDLNKYKKYGQLSSVNMNGMIKYIVGSFSDYSAAQQLREKIIAGSIKGAFVVGYYDGKIIPASKAVNMLK